MNSEVAEYIPESDQGSTQSNDKEKSPEQLRKKLQDQQTIFKAREDCTTDATLTKGARLLFTLLLDLALNPQVNNSRRGQIAISNTQLCELLHASRRAIYGWTKGLEEQRHIWVSKLPRPNMHAMNVIHITALQPKREIRQEVANDGMWGNGTRRPAPAMPLGARGSGGKKRHYLVDRFGNPLFAQCAENSPPTRINCPSHPQKSAPGTRKKGH